MTLLTVVRDVCAAVGVLQPQSVFTNITGNRTMQEMVSLANEMAQRIAYDTRDWTRLRKTVTYTGDDIVSPRLNASWQVRPRTTVRGAWGRYSQSQPLFALQAQDGLDQFFPAERAEHRRTQRHNDGKRGEREP